jgi:glycosyltransferase involved in cell wall biosynthesis
VVVLTESAKAILREREAEAHLASQEPREKQISVIPCCADLDRFRPTEPNGELQLANELEGRIVIGNIGAVNKRYMLPEMFRFFFHIKAHLPHARFVYLTQNDPSLVRAAARDAGLSEDDLLVTSVEPPDIPKWLSLFRLGVFFLKPSYAAKASSYTKLAEFLAAGVPVVTNKGVGDVENILGSNQSGVLVPGLTENDLAAAARRALSLIEGERVPEAVRESCRATAEKHFALDEGVERYFSIYQSLAAVELRGGDPVAVELG